MAWRVGGRAGAAWRERAVVWVICVARLMRGCGCAYERECVVVGWGVVCVYV